MPSSCALNSSTRRVASVAMAPKIALRAAGENLALAYPQQTGTRFAFCSQLVTTVRFKSDLVPIESLNALEHSHVAFQDTLDRNLAPSPVSPTLKIPTELQIAYLSLDVGVGLGEGPAGVGQVLRLRPGLARLRSNNRNRYVRCYLVSRSRSLVADLDDRECSQEPLATRLSSRRVLVPDPFLTHSQIQRNSKY